MRALLTAALVAAALAAPLDRAAAFCGFYVAKADGELFNDASQVVMVRDGARTVITMVNDYTGDPRDFAMVIPTPVVLSRAQINVGGAQEVARLDAYTAPRMVEYFDGDPCQPIIALESIAPTAGAVSDSERARSDALGVTVEARYTVGEYDILILSATESDGLQIWLDQNGYQTPAAAKPILASYIRQGMKFFVARVNLEAAAATGGDFLRPLQIAFESEKFMLPIRLGTANARGAQELILFTLTRTGRVETGNYRTVRIPTDVDVPLFVQKEFGDFYKAMFDRAVARENGSAVFLEYAWDMNWCDPCAADPLTVAELRKLGVFWLPRDGDPSRGVDVFATRLHVRYDAERFPEDLRLIETGDRGNFQGRYVTRQPFTGPAACAAGDDYRRELRDRWGREAETLARLTGWDLADIRAKMAASGQDPDALPKLRPWWETIWE